MIPEIQNLKPSPRILSLKNKTLNSERYLSIEQSKIITRIYQENESLPVIVKRAKALAASLSEMPIAIDSEELIVGNRTPDIRAGVVFPEAGINWLMKETDTLPGRPQDPFNVRYEDAVYFREVIEPYWRGKTLEDDIYNQHGDEISSIEKVVKINQKDHAQGHICPKVEDWLRFGPAGLYKIAEEKLANAEEDQKVFYQSVCITLKAATAFIHRYSILAYDLSKKQEDELRKINLEEAGLIC
jgi:pyruvate-formate lyase